MTYTYDALGNRSVMVDNLTMTNYTVSNLNQYTQIDLNSYSYDTNGNLTGDGTWTFGYDRDGHLISANKSGTSVTYKYDALGRRVEKNVNGTVTKYVYSGQDLIEERDASNNVTAKYVYAGGIDTPAKVIRATGTYYFQQDSLGNVTALSNASGEIVESYTYDAFGKPKIKDGGGNVIDIPSTPFLFTDREYDAETGLYHYRSRAYFSALGRFLQMDSIRFGGGDWNLYRYVGNNPVNLIDPNGACSITIFAGHGSNNRKIDKKFAPRGPGNRCGYVGCDANRLNDQSVKGGYGVPGMPRNNSGGFPSEAAEQRSGIKDPNDFTNTDEMPGKIAEARAAATKQAKEMCKDKKLCCQSISVEIRCQVNFPGCNTGFSVPCK